MPDWSTAANTDITQCTWFEVGDSLGLSMYQTQCRLSSTPALPHPPVMRTRPPIYCIHTVLNAWLRYLTYMIKVENVHMLEVSTDYDKRSRLRKL
ncbi:hypothetical protein CIHG_09891 [Coccidioides immitis H538.4]|uniref:Uncharacterized protein n=3 Tax=Coccidioides immitis TaxID=5501 RepID=A0A0J8R820_COCIT|nr:hypothetical protein CIRG_05132 [Coccidioides immitis RMSCC 2394]KMU81021.1 hypothetical protein CISG_08870 [Coccidioides immitis RMSCC 3703]KMU92053.1 hypothetical protein CIHG_09891 [Coccidioides immitis H538.4]